MSAKTHTYDIIWSPEGRKITTVEAVTLAQAKRKAPLPYRRFLGEMYAIEVEVTHVNGRETTCEVSANCLRHGGRCIL